MTLLLLLAVAPPTYNLQLRAPNLLRPHAAVTRTAAPCMQGEKVTLTLTLTGCKSGIGVGLDKENVDMLKPMKCRRRAMVMGDKVVSWNGEEMTRVVGGRIQQRMLKDVVKPSLDTHTVIVERVKKPGRHKPMRPITSRHPNGSRSPRGRIHRRGVESLRVCRRALLARLGPSLLCMNSIIAWRAIHSYNRRVAF